MKMEASLQSLRSTASAIQERIAGLAARKGRTRLSYYGRIVRGGSGQAVEWTD